MTITYTVSEPRDAFPTIETTAATAPLLANVLEYLLNEPSLDLRPRRWTSANHLDRYGTAVAEVEAKNGDEDDKASRRVARIFMDDNVLRVHILDGYGVEYGCATFTAWPAAVIAGAVTDLLLGMGE